MIRRPPRSTLFPYTTLFRSRWTRSETLPADALPVLWAHAERAPLGLLGVVRERGDVLSAIGPSAAATLMREADLAWGRDRKSTRLNSSHLVISYAVFCLKKK